MLISPASIISEPPLSLDEDEDDDEDSEDEDSDSSEEEDVSDLEESETEQEKDMLRRIYSRSIDDYDSDGICVNITSFHDLRATPVIR